MSSTFCLFYGMTLIRNCRNQTLIYACMCILDVIIFFRSLWQQTPGRRKEFWFIAGSSAPGHPVAPARTQCTPRYTIRTYYVLYTTEYMSTNRRRRRSKEDCNMQQSLIGNRFLMNLITCMRRCRRNMYPSRARNNNNNNRSTTVRQIEIERNPLSVGVPIVSTRLKWIPSPRRITR